MHHLEVGDVVAVATAAGAAGRVHGVEAVADAAVADRVEVHLKTRRVESRDVLLQFLGVEVGQAATGGPKAFGSVGLEHGRREVLADAVVHDLDGARSNAARRVLRRSGPTLTEAVQLVEAAATLEPERGGNPAGELPARRRSQ